MTCYVGLDVSMKETAICVVDEMGNRIWDGKSPTDPDAIAAVLARKAAEAVKIGIETGPMTVWLWHALTERELPVVCLHAKHAAAALKLQMNKTDRNDAFGLAKLVRSGWYRPVAVRSMETHRLRALLITRDQLVGMSTALINKIRGLAKTFGILIGPGKGARSSVRSGRPYRTIRSLPPCSRACWRCWGRCGSDSMLSPSSSAGLLGRVTPAA